MSRDDLPTIRHRGTLVDARLHLLDRQLLDDDGDPVGIVDDLELSGVEVGDDVAERSDAPRVTALLTGRAVTTRIFGGGPPRSLLQEIPWTSVAAVGVVVRLQGANGRFDVNWVERWLRAHAIRHIPGGGHAAE